MLKSDDPFLAYTKFERAAVAHKHDVYVCDRVEAMNNDRPVFLPCAQLAMNGNYGTEHLGDFFSQPCPFKAVGGFDLQVLMLNNLN